MAEMLNVCDVRKTFKLSAKQQKINKTKEKKIMKEYGSTDAGALLGDILGASIKEAEKKSKK